MKSLNSAYFWYSSKICHLFSAWVHYTFATVEKSSHWLMKLKFWYNLFLHNWKVFNQICCYNNGEQAIINMPQKQLICVFWYWKRLKLPLDQKFCFDRFRYFSFYLLCEKHYKEKCSTVNLFVTFFLYSILLMLLW